MANGSARQSASPAGRGRRPNPRRAKGTTATPARQRPGSRPAGQRRTRGAARAKKRNGQAHAIASQNGMRAQGVATVAPKMRSRDGGSVLDGARRFARSHPAWFWGGAFLTGLALARLFKATPPQQLSSSGLPRGEKPMDRSTYATSDEGGLQ
jgi:hypothetical protein